MFPYALCLVGVILVRIQEVVVVAFADRFKAHGVVAATDSCCLWIGKLLLERYCIRIESLKRSVCNSVSPFFQLNCL